MWTNEERQKTLLALASDTALSAEKRRYLKKMRAAISLLSVKTQVSISNDDINQCRLAQLQYLFNQPSHQVTDFIETSVESLVEIYGIYWAVSDFMDLNIALTNVAFIAKGISFVTSISLALFLRSLTIHEEQVKKGRALSNLIEYNQLQARQAWLLQRAISSHNAHYPNAPININALAKADQPTIIAQITDPRLQKPLQELLNSPPNKPKKSVTQAITASLASKKFWHSLLTGFAVFGGFCEIYWALSTIQIISALLTTNALLGLMVPIYGAAFAVLMGLIAAFYRYQVMKQSELRQQNDKYMHRFNSTVENATPETLNAIHQLDTSIPAEITAGHTTVISKTPRPSSKNKYSLTKKTTYFMQNTVLLTYVLMLTYWCISDVLKISLLFSIPVLSGALGIAILASCLIAFFLHRNLLRDEHAAKKQYTQIQHINTQRKAILQLLNKHHPIQEPEKPCAPFIPQKMPMLKMVTLALMTGAAGTLTLFASYYCVATIFSTLALLPVTSLLSALVLGAVVCAALAIGIYFAVKHYQRQVTIHQQQNDLMQIEHENRVLLTDIEKRLQSKKTSTVSEEFTKEGDLKAHDTPTTTDSNVRPSDHPTQPVATSGSSAGFWPVAAQVQPAAPVIQPALSP